MNNSYQQRLMNVLIEQRETEKSTMLIENNNQYVFKVAIDANKLEIKRAVELMFDGAEVESVKVNRVKGKQKMFGRMLGKRKDWKKAYVRLKAGFNIESMSN